RACPRCSPSSSCSSCPPVDARGREQAAVPRSRRREESARSCGFSARLEAAEGTKGHDMKGTPIPNSAWRVAPPPLSRYARAPGVPRRTATGVHLCPPLSGEKRHEKRPGAAINRSSGPLTSPFQGRARSRVLEVPVVVFGVLGLADDIGRTRAGEEVVDLIAARRERRKNGRIHLRDLLGEHRLVAEVHQRLVGVVVEEHLAV